MFLYFALLTLVCSWTVASDECQKMVKCFDEAIVLGEQCQKDVPVALAKENDPQEQLSKCEKLFQDAEVKELDEELKRGKAITNCLEDVKEDFYCPKISAERTVTRRKKRDGNEDEDDSSFYSDEEWENMPESCKQAIKKEKSCEKMEEDVNCYKLALCDLCFQKSDIAWRAIYSEIKHIRATKDCLNMDEEDTGKRRKKRFILGQGH